MLKSPLFSKKSDFFDGSMRKFVRFFADDLMEGGKPPRDCKQSLRPYEKIRASLVGTDLPGGPQKQPNLRIQSISRVGDDVLGIPKTSDYRKRTINLLSLRRRQAPVELSPRSSLGEISTPLRMTNRGFICCNPSCRAQRSAECRMQSAEL